MIQRSGLLSTIDPTDIGNIVVFGDIHGDSSALKNGLAAAHRDDVIVFLGDYADRGPDGVEVVEAIHALLEKHDDRVIALIGNHEDYSANGTPEFQPCTLIDEVERKLGSWDSYFPRFMEFHKRLSIAALLPGRLLFVHGGVNPAIESIASLETSGRDLINEILWSDPGSRSGLRSSRRGIGHIFGKDVSGEVLGNVGAEAIIRSHEPRKAFDGPYAEHDGRVLTLSSTGVYGGRPFVLRIDPRTATRSVEYIG